MASVEERERLQMKYLQMAKRFGWKISSKQSNESNENINHNISNANNANHCCNMAFVENNSFILSTPIPQQRNNSKSRLSEDDKSNSTSSNMQKCTFCGCQMSAFLIDNHTRHCSAKHKQNEDQKSPPSTDSNQAIISGLDISGMPAQSSNGILDLCSSEDDDDEYGNDDSKMSVMQSQKLEFDDSFCTQSPIIDQSRNHNNRNHSNQTPLLVRAERRRREEQQRIDHEFAMNLQREMEREQQLLQQQHEQRQHQQQLIEDRQLAEQHANNLRQQIAQERRQMHQQAQSIAENDLQRARLWMEEQEMFGQQQQNEEVNDVDISNLSYDALLELFPHEAHGAKEETIQRLPTSKFHKSGCNVDVDMNDDKHKCCVCLEQFKEGDEIRRLPCLHIFHKDEIDEWLRQNRACPICRFNVDAHQ